MNTRVRGCTKLTTLMVLAGALSAAVGIGAATSGDGGIGKQPSVPPAPIAPFSPSNARTEDGKLIPAGQFFPASRCAPCHRDTHTQWAESLHRNAGREPFYKESVDILQRTRGVEFTRHCESCHAPTALFSGALTKGSTEPRTLDEEGVTCSVCHAITGARLDGTGSYTIRRPALLAHEDGTPVFGEISDEQILADVPGHRRAVMRPLLKQPEFCATCHKSSAPPELNGYKFIRGFSAYDEWQQSGASHEAVAPFYRREQRADCRACHMPKVPAADDRAAKGGVISSHRWPGANTAAPLFYGQKEQAKLTEQFLKADVLSVDIFAVRGETTGERGVALVPAADNCLSLRAGEEVTAEVVVANRNAAHSFPPELRDLYEAWVEFEAVDGSGKTVFHSGFLNPDRSVDESAHVYKAILLDALGRPFTRHQVWLGVAKAYDNAIPPGRSDVVRFRFRLPQGSQAGAPVTLRARVNYRRFIQEYTDFVLGRRKARLEVPVVRMAETWVRLVGGLERVAEGGREAASLDLRRWNDYGIGLLEQAQYGAAAEAFKRAHELNPRDPNYLTSAAVAELRTERFGPERDQLGKAAALLVRALALDPERARTRFWWAWVLRAEGKPREAAETLAGLARQYPRDREVQRQLGQTLYALGRLAGARASFESVIAIDPTDAGAYQFLAPIYTTEGRAAEAERARALYLQWRDDPLADGVAARFYAAYPQWADERIWSHTHSDASPLRPTLTGLFAAPDK